jgi:hypothetical protein
VVAGWIAEKWWGACFNGWADTVIRYYMKKILTGAYGKVPVFCYVNFTNSRGISRKV